MSELLDYFNAEMRLLQESGQEFAEAYPEQAGMLNLNLLRDRDPYIERLLEGVAFLTANIRKKINDDLPEVYETLLNQFNSHMLKPFPSTIIMQFKPRLGQLQQTYILAKGSYIQSSPVGEKDNKVACKFRTTSKVIVNPLSIIAAQCIESPAGDTTIKLTFQSDPGIAMQSLDLHNLKIYLHADSNTASTLLYLLTHATGEIKILFPESPSEKPQLLEASTALNHCHLSTDDSLLPVSRKCFSGFRLLHDYFCCQQKYFFISLTGLEKMHWPSQCQQFTCEIHSKIRLPRDHHITENTFRLHCSPAINLFQTSSEPILCNHRQIKYPVIADIHQQQNNIIYSVDKVIGIDHVTGTRQTYAALYENGDLRTEQPHYSITQKCMKKNATKTSISINNRLKHNRETLLCDITVTNGHLPRIYLHENCINVTGKDVPNFIQCNNITRPSIFYSPYSQEHYQWLLTSHLSLNYQTLTNLNTLKQLLLTYEWTQKCENQQRIDSIRQIKAKPIAQIFHGALTRGLELQLTVNEKYYSSAADIYQFGLILHSFFTLYTTINNFIITRLHCHPSNRTYLWNSLQGEKLPL